jgi:Txe/YoeB family toxin of Txe-Axe toxin-antitoxin module
MNILPINPVIIDYLTKRGLMNKFEKQISYFRNNPFHTSLNTELLEPKAMRVWSFRVDKKYRSIFIFHAKDTIEILEVNDHYK